MSKFKDNTLQKNGDQEPFKTRRIRKAKRVGINNHLS
jgi:hypothetical protein